MKSLLSLYDAQHIEDLPLDFNVAENLIDHNLAAGRGSKIAVIDRSGETTYAQLSDRIDRMGGILSRLHIKREQRIILCLLDTVDFPTAFLGAIKAGVIPIPVNTLLVAEDYKWIVEDSGAVAVLVSEELLPQWSGIADDFPDVQFIISDDTSGRFGSFRDLIETTAPLSQSANTHRDDIAFWLYTSGSTGRPKAAMHTHASVQLTANLFAIGVMGYCCEDIILSVAKQFFAYGLGNSLTFPYAVGATVILNHERATAEVIIQLMRRYKVTILNGVPTFYAGWLAHDKVPSQKEIPDLRIATSAGEALPSHLGEAFADRYAVDIIDGLGSTEMLHIFLSQVPGAVRYGYTGKPVPGYELRIVDDFGQEVGPNMFGELQVKGPTAAVGYWRNRLKSIETFQGQWTRTGDKYEKTSDGWYKYGGRSDDMLKVGGIYVSPAEVEMALASHDVVLEAAVVGIPDSDNLIKPCAHIVLCAGYEPSRDLEEELKRHVKNLLSPYKYPRWIIFSESLPKTETGKIQRFRLRDVVKIKF